MRLYIVAVLLFVGGELFTFTWVAPRYGVWTTLCVFGLPMALLVAAHARLLRLNYGLANREKDEK